MNFYRRIGELSYLRGRAFASVVCPRNGIVLVMDHGRFTRGGL